MPCVAHVHVCNVCSGFVVFLDRLVLASWACLIGLHQWFRWLLHWKQYVVIALKKIVLKKMWKVAAHKCSVFLSFFFLMNAPLCLFACQAYYVQCRTHVFASYTCVLPMTSVTNWMFKNIWCSHTYWYIFMTCISFLMSSWYKNL